MELTKVPHIKTVRLDVFELSLDVFPNTFLSVFDSLALEVRSGVKLRVDDNTTRLPVDLESEANDEELEPEELAANSSTNGRVSQQGNLYSLDQGILHSYHHSTP